MAFNRCKWVTVQRYTELSITKYAAHSPSWEADSRSDIQEFLCLLWNNEFHYSDHSSPPVASVKPHDSSSVSYRRIFLRPLLILSAHLRQGQSCLFRRKSCRRTYRNLQKVLWVLALLKCFLSFVTNSVADVNLATIAAKSSVVNIFFVY
jgi:hypothetical protein